MTAYPPKKMKEILRDLHIQPDKEGYVSGNDAAHILSWRALFEFNIEYAYTAKSVRLQFSKGRPHHEQIKSEGPTKRNWYPVQTIFSLEIAPRRAISRKKERGKLDAIPH